MELVRARAHRQADDSAGEPPVLGGEAGSLDPELLDSVKRRADLGTSVDWIPIADAVDIEIGLVAAGSVDGGERSPRRTPRHHPGHEEREIREIPALERQVLDLLVDNHVALDGSTLEVDGRRRRSDRDRLGDRPELKFHVKAHLLAGFELEVRADESSETLRRDNELVCAGNQAKQSEVAGLVGLGLGLDSCQDVRDRNAGSRDNGHCRVGNDTGHRGETDLGGSGHSGCK